MNEAQQPKGMGVYAYVNTNKLRSFHVRSKSECGVQHIEVEGKEAMQFQIDEVVKETKDNARDRMMQRHMSN